jgi:hypothetical protein
MATRPVGLENSRASNQQRLIQKIVEVLNGMQGVNGPLPKVVRVEDLLAAGVFQRAANGGYAYSLPAGYTWLSDVSPYMRTLLSDANIAAALTTLGASETGAALLQKVHVQGSVVYPRVNANNTIDYLEAAAFRAAIGAGTGSGSGDGTVQAVLEGTGIDVNATDPVNPVVALSAAAIASLALADSATQPGDLAAVATSGAYADLTGKPTLGTAAAAATTDFATAAQGALADTAVQAAEKGAALGVATLDASTKVPVSQLPATAITNTSVVASQAAMLALTAEVGDIAVRTDISETFILQAEPATVLGNWVQLLFPADAVSSVFGRTGIITAEAGDYAAYYDAIGTAAAAVAAHAAAADPHPQYLTAAEGNAAYDAIGAAAAAQAASEPVVAAGAKSQFYRGDKGWSNTLLADAASLSLTVGCYGGPVTFFGYSAEGTEAVPAPTANGTGIAAMTGGGYDTALTGGRGRIRINASQTWAAGANGTELRFETTANGSTTMARRWTVQNDGHFVPFADVTHDVGTAALRVRATYSQTVHLSGAKYDTGVENLASAVSVNDVAIAATTRVVRIVPSAAFNITGLVGSAGRRVLLINTVNFNVTLTHQDGASSAANRFICPGSVSFVLNVNDSVELWYDIANNRWRVLGV